MILINSFTIDLMRKQFIANCKLWWFISITDGSQSNSPNHVDDSSVLLMVAKFIRPTMLMIHLLLMVEIYSPNHVEFVRSEL